MVDEARLEETEGGLAPATEGWFVVNVRDGRWMTNDVLGDAFIVEGDNVSFGQVIFMTGARVENKETVYPRSELAIRHGAGVETDTSSSAEAYAPFPKWKDGR